MTTPAYWIIGAGRFGRRACERLRRINPAASIQVVDHREVAAPEGAVPVRSDALEFLETHLESRTEAWIIPAVPIHLAYEWLARQLAGEKGFHPQAVPAGLMPALPNPCRGAEGQVYVSNADFSCPHDCPEPKTICPSTGEPRPRVMHTFLSELAFEDYTALVIRSRQLAPGVGGFQAATLWDCYRRLRTRRGRFLFSTACKCHGVVDAFTLD
jgi:hypothetical protein